MRADSFNMGTNRWFTSDLHFGHANIIRFCERPFDDVHHMNVAICENINNAVTPEDELWILGDLAMGNVDKTIPIVRRFTAGRTVLVPSNHDKCHPMFGEKADRWRPVYEKSGLVIAEPSTTLTLANGVEVEVNHFPYTGDSRDKDRFEQWRPADTGTRFAPNGKQSKFQKTSHGMPLQTALEDHKSRLGNQCFKRTQKARNQGLRLPAEWQ